MILPLEPRFQCQCAACKALPGGGPGITQRLAFKLSAIEESCHASIGPSFKLSVSSGYRCKAHNAAIGGAPDSQHCNGVAADIVTDDSAARYALVDAALALGLPFVEVCPSHIHVDLRAGTKRLILGKDS